MMHKLNHGCHAASVDGLGRTDWKDLLQFMRGTVNQHFKGDHRYQQIAAPPPLRNLTERNRPTKHMNVAEKRCIIFEDSPVVWPGDVIWTISFYAFLTPYDRSFAGCLLTAGI